MSVCTGVSVKTNAINIVLLHHGSWFPESGMHSASTVGRYGIYLVYGTLNCNGTVTGPNPTQGFGQRLDQNTFAPLPYLYIET
jgi:hypothetical protein